MVRGDRVWRTGCVRDRRAPSKPGEPYQSDCCCHSSQGNSSCFFKGCLFRNVECRVCFGNGILSERAMRLHHFMESSDAVSHFELCHTCSYFMDIASNIVSGVVGKNLRCPDWTEESQTRVLSEISLAWDLHFPVFGICSGNYHFD